MNMFCRNNKLKKLGYVQLQKVIPRGLNDPEVTLMGHPEALAEGSPNLYVTQVTRNSADKIFTIERDSSLCFAPFGMTDEGGLRFLK